MGYIICFMLGGSCGFLLASLFIVGRDIEPKDNNNN